MSVKFEYINQWAVVTLQKPRTLNALDLEMVLKIREFLELVKDKSDISGVLIQSSVKNVFCAGGDIKEVYRWYHENNHKAMVEYIQEEYGLNAYIRSFPKPIVCIMDGVTLGGGVGLSRYAPYRIATDQAVMGMPEVKIAFFPDVGAGYFLNLLNQPLARFLALTGYTLKGQDLITTGYITHLVSSKNIDVIVNTILATNPKDLNKTLSMFTTSGASELDSLSPVIECFRHASLLECMNALKDCSSVTAKRVYAEMLTFSPLALHIIWRYMEITRGLNYEAVLKIDLQLAQSMFDCSDFFEGIRTRLIDKEDIPRWKKSVLVDVFEQDIECYFSSIEVL
jgi:enoyl-CoA hydratase/carnithine racemase